MGAHLMLPSRVPSIIITLFFLLIFAQTSYCEDGIDKDYEECRRPFTCGNLTDLSYPFWSDSRPEICGLAGFKLQCRERETPVINVTNQEIRILKVNRSPYEITIAIMDFWERACPDHLVNTTINNGDLNYFPGFGRISLFYNCGSRLPDAIPSTNKFQCSVGEAFYATNESERELGISQCSIRMDFLVPSMALEQDAMEGFRALANVLQQGLNVPYLLDRKCPDCEESGGTCVTDSTSAFTCFCRDGRDNQRCRAGNGRSVRWKLVIGFAAAFGGVAVTCIIFYICRHHKKNSYARTFLVSRSIMSDFSSKSDIEKGGHYVEVHLFTYAELEEATNNFDSAKELGEGGFGTVYHGKLHDGRAVAVKRLYENSNKRVEQFMNEVDILTRLRHQNLVLLYGCTSRHSRELLLVYEYISNGTVADHLHGERAKPGALPWPTRMKIAVETASALSYLHASDVIHRDVKTNNILLDNYFCVKVADFGLSRLFPIHVTHVSTAPQGTPGYVDPEYHECYQLTDKSDVYSFGVVLIELISSMPAVDITRHRHEINLSNMAINKIQSDALDELVDKNLGFETDYAVRKMITAVAELAFQCLQSAKDLRPSMEEVLDTLKEIQSKDYSMEKAGEMDIQSDDVVLLKSNPLPRSPDTVMMQWTSTDTTPNVSG